MTIFTFIVVQYNVRDECQTSTLGSFLKIVPNRRCAFERSVTFLYLENRFSILLMFRTLFMLKHRLCPHKHNFPFFLEILTTMISCFRHQPVHVLLILRMGHIRWNSFKCKVMYCIGYHARFMLINNWFRKNVSM